MKNKLKNIAFATALFLAATFANAQVKIGNNPTTIGATTNLEVEAVNGNKVKISADTGKVTIADGTQGDGKILISDANGQASWSNSSTSILVNSTGGVSTSLGLSRTYTGAYADIEIAGYYLVSTRVLTDKSIGGCGSFLAFNLSKSDLSIVDLAFPMQDPHVSAGAGIYDCLYTTQVAYLTPGKYYLMLRYDGAGGCVNTVRAGFSENSFTCILLK